MNRREGSQVQRTVLAWDRTALALVGNGVLLMVRDVGASGGPAFAAAGVAVVAGLVVAVLGRRRARALRPGVGASAGTTLHVAGAAVVAVGVCVSVVLVLSATS